MLAPVRCPLVRPDVVRRKTHRSCSEGICTFTARRKSDRSAVDPGLAMDMDERWVHRSPETMLETFHWFRGEGFGLIVEDLLRLPRVPGVVVEGIRLLPHLVKPLLSRPGQA